MTLREFFDTHEVTTQALADEAGVSRATVRNALAGMLISRYETARRVSVATGGVVTVQELCERTEGRST
jgi:AcrR family transcriptional regulator